jgi:hypothetical protein
VYTEEVCWVLSSLTVLGLNDRKCTSRKGEED